MKTAFAQRHAQLEGVSDTVPDLAASLQAAIADCLADRAKQAMQQFAANHGPSTLVIAGGVAANATIFAQLEREALKAGFRLSVPPGYLCTDNAAMIAWAALERREAPHTLDFEPLPRWPLDPDAAPPPGQGVRS